MDSFFFLSMMCLLIGISLYTSLSFTRQKNTIKKVSQRPDMCNQNWAEIIDNYLQSKRKGALVISGPWGTGKTHLFEHTISSILVARGRGVKHVSLYSYGLNGKALDDIIIQEVVGVADVDSNSKQGSQALITSALSFFASSDNAGILGAAVSTVGGAVKRRIVAGLESQIICFDDLDRLAPELLHRAWAEINFFTEIKSWKVIILVDENRLPGGSVYTPELEKNVWGSIVLDVTPKRALVIAFESLSRDSIGALESILDSHLVPVVEHLGVVNIRIIMMALEKVCYAANAIEAVSDQCFDIVSVNNLYQKIFLCALVPREGMNRGAIIETLSEAIDVRARITERAINSLRVGEATATVSLEQQFIDELPNFSSLPIPMPFIPEFLAKGFFQADALVKCLILTSQERELEFVEDDLITMASVRGKLDTSVYLEFSNSVLNFLSDPPHGNYRLIHFSALVSAVLEDACYGGLEQDLTLVESVVSKAVDIVLAGIEAETHRFDPDSLSLANFPSVISPTIRQYMVDIQKAAQQKNELKGFLNSLEGWQSDPELKLLSEALNSFSYPALVYIGFDALKDFIQQADGRTINNFNWMLGRRYTIDGAVKVVGQEVEIVEELLSFYKGFSERGYRRVAINTGIPILEHAVIHCRRVRSNNS